jgi:hypothetical protein
MAAFVHYPGPPFGEALLSRRKKLPVPDGDLGLHDFEVVALGISVDPFVPHKTWSGPTLDAIRTELQQKLRRWEEEALQTVLTRTHRERPEPWMQTMITEQEFTDPRLAHGRALLDLIERARSSPGTLVFWGD